MILASLCWIRPKILGVVGERLLHRVQHLGNVPGMLFQVVDLDLDSVPIAARHLISRRNEGIEIQRVVVELVLVVVTSILRPFPLQRSRSDRDLVGRRADHGFHVHPIRVVAEIGVHAVGGAVLLERRHQIFFFQPELLALVPVGHLIGRLVADHGRHRAVEEGSVLHDLAVGDRIFEAAIPGLDGKVHDPRLTRLHGRIQRIGLKQEPRVVLGELSSGQIDLRVVIVRPG